MDKHNPPGSEKGKPAKKGFRILGFLKKMKDDFSKADTDAAPMEDLQAALHTLGQTVGDQATMDSRKEGTFNWRQRQFRKKLGKQSSVLLERIKGKKGGGRVKEDADHEGHKEEHGRRDEVAGHGKEGGGHEEGGHDGGGHDGH